jgi:hypothetical protein
MGGFSAAGTDVSVGTGAIVAASVACGDENTGAVVSVSCVAGLTQADSNPTITGRTKTFNFIETILRALLKPV